MRMQTTDEAILRSMLTGRLQDSAASLTCTAQSFEHGGSTRVHDRGKYGGLCSVVAGRLGERFILSAVIVRSMWLVRTCTSTASSS